MRAQRRSLLVAAAAAAAVLLLAIVVADEPPTSPEPPAPTGSQTPEPMADLEPRIPSKAEASGENEMAGPSERTPTGVPPVSFAGADRSHTDELNGDVLNSGASHLGPFSLDLLPGDTTSGPGPDLSVHSHESQESVDHEVDSEESLASQGM